MDVIGTPLYIAANFPLTINVRNLECIILGGRKSRLGVGITNTDQRMKPDSSRGQLSGFIPENSLEVVVETSAVRVITEGVRNETESVNVEKESVKAETDSVKTETDGVKAAGESVRAETDSVGAERESVSAKMGGVMAESPNVIAARSVKIELNFAEMN